MASQDQEHHDLVELKSADNRYLYIIRVDWVAAGKPATVEELHANLAKAAAKKL